MRSQARTVISALALATYGSGCAGPSREEFNATIDSKPALSQQSSFEVARPYPAVVHDIRSRASTCYSRVRANSVTMSADATQVYVLEKGSGLTELSLKMGSHFVLTVDITAKGTNASRLNIRQFNAWSNGEAATILAWAEGQDAACKYGILQLPF